MGVPNAHRYATRAFFFTRGEGGFGPMEESRRICQTLDRSATPGYLSTLNHRPPIRVRIFIEQMEMRMYRKWTMRFHAVALAAKEWDVRGNPKERPHGASMGAIFPR